MGVPKRLTDMQRRFVELLVYGDPKTGEPLNQTEASKHTGDCINLSMAFFSCLPSTMLAIYPIFYILQHYGCT